MIVQGAPVDFVVALVVSDLLDDVILAGVPVAQGVVAIGSVMLLHALLAFAAYRNESLARLLGLGGTPLIARGKVVREKMHRETISDDELASYLRELEIEDPSQVEDAWLEPSGSVSVKRREEFKTAEKRDLAELDERGS